MVFSVFFMFFVPHRDTTKQKEFSTMKRPRLNLRYSTSSIAKALLAGNGGSRHLSSKKAGEILKNHLSSLGEPLTRINRLRQKYIRRLVAENKLVLSGPRTYVIARINNAPKIMKSRIAMTHTPPPVAQTVTPPIGNAFTAPTPQATPPPITQSPVAQTVTPTPPPIPAPDPKKAALRKVFEGLCEYLELVD